MEGLPMSGEGIADLSRVVRRLRQSTLEFVDASTRISSKRTETVAGVLGGSVGMTGAYVICATSAVLSFWVLGPLVGLVGISGGVLFARRFNRQRNQPGFLERQNRIEEARSVSGYIQDQINSLGPGTPKAIRDDLYRQLVEANRRMVDVVIEDRPSQVALPPPTLQLPAPEPERRT